MHKLTIPTESGFSAQGYAFGSLKGSLTHILDKIDAVLIANGYSGPQVKMYLAGGMAVNFYCATRYTEDIDASFSRRLLLPYKDMQVAFIDESGVSSCIYLDANYNTSFALMHEDFEDESIEWEGIGNEGRLVQLRVLHPLDLAISKIARYSEQDVDDILSLARQRYFSSDELQSRSLDALQYYVVDGGRHARRPSQIISRAEILTQFSFGD